MNLSRSGYITKTLVTGNTGNVQAALDKLTEDLNTLSTSLESRLSGVEADVNTLKDLDLDTRVLDLKTRLDFLTEDPE